MCQWRLGKARNIRRCKCNIRKHLSVRWPVVACFMPPVFPSSIRTFLHFCTNKTGKDMVKTPPCCCEVEEAALLLEELLEEGYQCMSLNYVAKHTYTYAKCCWISPTMETDTSRLKIQVIVCIYTRFRWLLTAVLCGWRYTKSFGTACQDVERILVIVLKWIYGTWGDMCIVSVFVSLLPTKHRRAFCFVCACISYEDLQGIVYRDYPFGHIDEILYWPQARLLCPTLPEWPRLLCSASAAFPAPAGCVRQKLGSWLWPIACGPIRHPHCLSPCERCCFRLAGHMTMQSYAVLLEIYINLI